MKQEDRLPQTSMRGSASALLAALAVALSGAAAARAEVISSTPTLPVLGVPYASSVGTDCFPTAGVCIAGGSFTFTSVATSGFNINGQDIVANLAFTGALTTLGHVPISPLNLTGTMEEEIIGRTTSFETGAWPIELLALSLSGPVLGHTLTLGLDPSQTSTGGASITQFGGDVPMFRIDSFFDVFVELDLDSTPPLHALRGPVHLSQAPEPTSLALLAGGLAAMALRRRKPAAT